MEEDAILEDAVVKVMVVTKPIGVAGKPERLHKHGRGNGQTGDRAHCYAFPRRSEAKTSDVVITGNLLVCNCMDFVLFDPGSTFLYVSSSFSTGLNLHCEMLYMPIRVSTPVGESVIV